MYYNILGMYDATVEAADAIGDVCATYYGMVSDELGTQGCICSALFLWVRVEKWTNLSASGYG